MQPENISYLNIDLLIPNSNQPRKKFDDNSLNELSLSIKEYGILNPILVRKKDNLYEIIAGERRYKAARMAGLKEVPVIIKDVDDNKVSEIAITENIQRENISPIEEAKSYKEILDKKNITEKELSAMIGKSQPFIANKIRLLKLPIQIQDALINKKISEKHARTLLTINNSEKQIEMLEMIINKKLSVKDLEEIIKKEEKESDNMNNGNFFPNFNTQPNTVSLNSMNMQSMNNNQINPTENMIPKQNTIIPNTPNIENFNSQPILNDAPVGTESTNNDMNKNIETTIPNLNQTIEAPVSNINMNNQNSINPSFNSIPEQNNEILTQNNNMESSTPVVDIPLFSEQNFNQDINNNNNIQASAEGLSQPSFISSEPVNNTPEQPMMPETPLFNQELSNQSIESTSNVENTNLNESFYDVPVNISPVIEDNKGDKVNKVQQLLSSNGIEYKTYSNETGHCIIIEI